jgi:hypothetical protein
MIINRPFCLRVTMVLRKFGLVNYSLSISLPIKTLRASGDMGLRKPGLVIVAYLWPSLLRPFVPQGDNGIEKTWFSNCSLSMTLLLRDPSCLRVTWD